MRKSRVMAFVVALVLCATLVQAQARGDADRAPRGECGMGRGGDGRPGAARLFKGVRLSDTERAAIRTIREKYRAQGQELRKTQRPAMDEIRALRQKGDTAGARAAFERTKGDREKARGLLGQERNDIRGALSADNQKTFDANAKKLEARRAKWVKKGREGRSSDGE